MSNEDIFYDTLEKIFTGAQVQGKGGFINLLAIKHSYYKKVLQIFKKQIEECNMVDDTREELFDRLYTFFKKYFSECGSVYYCQTAYSDKVYEKVYTNNKDVVLFYKTSMLYYVKSETLFQNMIVRALDKNGRKRIFAFDARNIQNKKSNEKKELVFSYDTFATPDFITNEDGSPFAEEVFILKVAYSENGSKTKFDDIVRQMKIDEKTVKKALDTFKKQSSVDYFINKDAKKFLTEQLDLYTHQILLNEKNEFSEYRLNQLKTFKDFAQKIIDFISQFENELVKVWNKPKFPRSANYVITLDRLAKLSGDILQKVSASAGLKDQIKEWQDLGMVDGDFDFNKRSEKHEHLPLDTKYFKDLEAEILSQFDNLDEELDGRLIHSENYQALNTLKDRYREKVQCVYIDPMFNLDNNADFFYLTNYKDSTWTTILADRLNIVRNFLKDKGSIFVRCDYNGNYIVRCLLDTAFGNECFKNEIIIAKTKEFFKTMTNLTKFAEETESLFFYAKDKNKTKFTNIYKDKNEVVEYPPFFPVEDKNYSDNRIINNISYSSPKGRKWGIKQEDIDEKIRNKTLIQKNGKWTLIVSKEIIKNNWTDFQGYSRLTDFKTENSEIILQRVISATSDKDDIVIDFFAGSGTTQAVAQKLGRKWLGVEQGEHFYTIILPRLKKVLFGLQNGISKSLNSKYYGGGFFKYYTMEQYEDTLQKMHYDDSDALFSTKHPFENYAFLTDEKFSYVLKTSGENNDIAEIDFDALYPDIDFAETISLAKGLAIKQIKEKSVTLSDGKEYSFDFEKMTAEEKVGFIQMLKPFLWWGE